MELRQLKYFVKAAELANFTAASQALFITQSTLSQQIKTLEDELNTPLFDRVAKRVRLTEAGKLFLPSAVKTIKDAEDGKQLLKDLGNVLTGCLNIGLTYGLSHLLIKTLITFAGKYPKLRLQVIYGTSQELLEMLTAGNLDFVLSFYKPQNNETFQTQLLFESTLSLIVHQDSELANAKTVTLKQLAGLPLALPVDKYSIREFLNVQLARQQMVLDIFMEVNDIDTLLQLAETQQWYTVLMSSSLFNYPKLKAIPLTGKEMIREACITWPAGVYRKKAAILFTDLLCNANNNSNPGLSMPENFI